MSPHVPATVFPGYDAYGGSALPHANTQAPTSSGAYRPDVPFVGENMQVTLRAERGVTPKGFLAVPFRFQAPPLDRFGRDWEFDYNTYSTLRLGERPREAGPKLDRPSFSTMFVDEPYPWLAWDGAFTVQRFLSELRALMDRPAPFRLVIGQPALWGAYPLVNTVAVLTSIKPEARGGEPGTEYTDVEFLAWPRDELAEQRSTSGGSSKAKRRPSSKDQDRRHTLKAGDTLYGIAQDAYHKASDWHTIAKGNGITGVRPDSAAELSKWAKAHHRSTLVVPKPV